MRIVHWQSEQGAPMWGAWREEGSAEVLAGPPWLTARPVLTGVVAVPGRWGPPVHPVNIFGIGLNYRRHAAEGGKPVPDRPMVFLKSTNAVTGPTDPIVLPAVAASAEVDYECELAVVIGRTARNVRPEQALDYVLGYTVANDVSARDWQFRWGGGQFCQGKGLDSFCPLGPALVTADEVPDPQSLRLRTWVNGELRQDSSTADMVFDVRTLIAFLSSSRTLLPGTVILTGTPEGVGYARRPPAFLRAGDRVEMEIEGLGRLDNPVVTEEVKP